MARRTIEDSLKSVSNVYELIHLAAYRAHQLEHGAKPKVNPEESAPTVLALREIAAGYTDFGSEFENENEAK